MITDQFVYNSFFFSYIFLFGLSLITFIEAMRTKSMKIRHILNLETAVSLIAGFVYSILVTKLDKKEISLDDITNYRYMDWFITTPLLLLVLILFYNYRDKKPIYFSIYLLIIIINYCMLYSGYLGENNKNIKYKACIIGFVFYSLLIYIIWYNFLSIEASYVDIILFITFATIWGLYGIVYLIQNIKLKNICYNILDIIAKVFFGIFMWVYYGNIFDIEKA